MCCVCEWIGVQDVKQQETREDVFGGPSWEGDINWDLGDMMGKSLGEKTEYGLNEST